MIRKQFFLTLLLAATLVSQGLAQQHVHVEDVSASCLVCAHADNTPTTESHPAAPAYVCTQTEIISAEVRRSSEAPTNAPRVRGPPNLQQN